MMIFDLIYRATARKRKKAKIECVRQRAVGLCVAVTAVSFGVAIGVLIAPKSGKQTRAGLKKSAAKSVDTIEKVVSEITDDKEKD